MRFGHGAAARPRPLVVLLAGRDDWRRDVGLNRILLARLDRPDRQLVWEDPATEWVHAWLRWIEFWPRLGRRRLLVWGVPVVVALHALAHPLSLFNLAARVAGWVMGSSPLERRLAGLRRRVRTLARHGPVAVLARSAGGRFASMLADSEDICQVICLGYPFCHPLKGGAAERIAPLVSLRTPTLIIQGRGDTYGGVDLVSRYTLSPMVTVRFIETDHEFHLDEATLDGVIAAIDTTLAHAGRAKEIPA